MLVPLLFCLVSSYVRALEVTSTSSCIGVCEGPSLTFPENLTCIDNLYSATSESSTFRACLQCESSSTALDGAINPPQNNDVYWFLFNMKYTLQYCLFQDGNTTTPNVDRCQSSCAGLYPVLDTSWFATPRPGQYEYCKQNNTAFQRHCDTCANCLRAYPGSVILGNFLKTMLHACETKPQASLGQTIRIQRGIFNSATVNPNSAATSSPSSTSSSTPTSSPTSSASSSPASSSASPSPTHDSNSGLSSSAAAGIGVGVGIGGVAILAAVVFFIYHRKRRRSPNNSNASGEGDGRSPLYNTQGQQSGWPQDIKKDRLAQTPSSQQQSYEMYSPPSEAQTAERYELPTNEMDPTELDGRDATRR